MDVGRGVEQVENDKRTRRTKRSCMDIRLAVRRGEKKRLSVQHMTSIFWRKTANAEYEIIIIQNNNKARDGNINFQFFFPINPCTMLEACDWHHFFDEKLRDGIFLDQASWSDSRVEIPFFFLSHQLEHLS